MKRYFSRLLGPALLCLSLSACRNSIPFHEQYPESIGFVLGEAAKQDVPGGGEILVFLSPQQHALAKSIRDAHQSGLGKALQSGGVSPVYLADELWSPEEMQTTGVIPPGVWEKAIRQHPSAQAVISFTGLPPPELMSETLPVYLDATEHIPPILNLPGLVAVVQRKPEGAIPGKPGGSKSLREIFKDRFTITRL